MAQQGTIAFVSELPECNFEHTNAIKARYDFRTAGGSWAYGCQSHYESYRMHEDLGLGKGQRLVTEKERKERKERKEL